MSDNQYLVSARKYRPQDWEEVVGQDGITQTLRQSIESGQIAQAYLFCGPRGVGKTTSARIFARAINGFSQDDDSISFNVFELDAASNNKVEDIRSIVEQVRIPPQNGSYKVYIIDEVHMLSQAAFNAFLKTLEEPPAHAVFILATTEKHKILPTILSRCQIFDFHRISVPDMVSHLKGIAEKEGVNASDEGLHVIAAKADGALRDSLSMFDQLVAFAGKDLTYEIVTEQLHVLDHETYFEVIDFALNHSINDSMLLFDRILSRGFDAHHFLTGLGSHLRNLMVCRDAKTLKLFEATDEVKVKFAEQAKKADLCFIVGALDIVNEADTQYRGSQHQRLLVELALMKICSLSSTEKKKTDVLIRPAEARDELVAQPTPQFQPTPQPTPTPQPAPQPQPTPAPQPTPTSVSTIESELTPASAPKPKPRAASKPTGLLGGVKLAGRSAKLAGAVDQKDEKEVKILDESWTKIPDLEGVKKVWSEFVEKQRVNGKINLVASLSMCEIKLEGKTVIFDIVNELQDEQLNSERADLLYYLRKNLQCVELELTIDKKKIAEGSEAPKVFLNDKEKYLKMAEKNPALEDLRKRLDLDLA
jgi:DNA polymerase-3 subunit gamma/tau